MLYVSVKLGGGPGQVPIVREQLPPVVLHDVVVVVHHDGQRLAEDEGEPDHDVAHLGTQPSVDEARDGEKRCLEQGWGVILFYAELGTCVIIG